jgi:hypothetical protein
MDESDYVDNVKMWAGLCRSVTLIPIEDIRAALEIAYRFEAVAPFVDPTAWMRGGDTNLREQQKFLVALLAFRRVLDSCQPQRLEQHWGVLKESR